MFGNDGGQSLLPVVREPGPSAWAQRYCLQCLDLGRAWGAEDRGCLALPVGSRWVGFIQRIARDAC